MKVNPIRALNNIEVPVTNNSAREQAFISKVKNTLNKLTDSDLKLKDKYTFKDLTGAEEVLTKYISSQKEISPVVQELHSQIGSKMIIPTEELLDIEQIFLRELSTKIDEYKEDHGTYPQSIEELKLDIPERMKKDFANLSSQSYPSYMRNQFARCISNIF